MLRGKPRVLLVGRTRYRLPLDSSLRRKFDALREVFELRVLGMRDVGLQREFETILAYRVTGTPSAVLVSPDGRIAAPIAQAAYAIEALVRLTLRSGVASSSRRLQRLVFAAGA